MNDNSTVSSSCRPCNIYTVVGWKVCRRIFNLCIDSKPAEALKPQHSVCDTHPFLSMRVGAHHTCTAALEALAVNDAGAGLVVLALGDPHLLERGQGGQDGSTDPHGVFALRWGNHLDLHGRGSQCRDFLGQALADAGEHGGPARQDNVGVQILADIDIALHDRLEHGVVDTFGFLSDHRRLEQNFWATEAFVTDGDNITIRQFVRLFVGAGARTFGHVLVKVQGDVRQLFLDVTHDFTLGGGGELVATFSQDLHQVIGQIATGKIDTHDRMGKGVTFVDRDRVGNTVTGVQDGTGGTPGGVQGKHGLNVDVHGRDVKRLEHDLCHALAVGFGVQRGFRQENRVFFRGDAKFVVKGVVPDLFHIVPVGHDTVFDRVLQGQDTTLVLGFIANVRVFLVHTDHDTLVLGAPYNRGEDRAGGVITSESSFAHTGTVVDDQGLGFFFIISHVEFVAGGVCVRKGKCFECNVICLTVGRAEDYTREDKAGGRRGGGGGGGGGRYARVCERVCVSVCPLCVAACGANLVVDSIHIYLF